MTTGESGWPRARAPSNGQHADAVPGRGPGLFENPAGTLGVVISYEVFFPGRACAAVTAGGEVLLVPTNAASCTTEEVPPPK